MQCAYLFGPRDLRFVEREPDALRPDEVRVEVACSGICGTDLHIYGGMVFGAAVSEPRPFDHEFAGRVVDVGSAVSTSSVGERVTAIPNTPCGKCSLCRSGRAPVCQNRVTLRGGAWARSIVVPAQNIFPLPDSVSDRLGALTEPLSCGVRAVDRSGLRSGDRVCVIGAGPIGLFAAVVAKASGASTVIVSEPRAYRRNLARRLGIDQVVDPSENDVAEAVRDLTDGLGADVVFEAVGFPRTIEQAISVAAPGATLVVVGVTDATARASFNPQEMFFKELTIRGTKGPTFAVERAIRWLATLDLAPVITHTFPLSAASEAIELGLTGNAGKILLEPS
jgi:2-desacetyl-2-hydroxyethyl bacteriochlorophyllide A dehydrogenase